MSIDCDKANLVGGAIVPHELSRLIIEEFAFYVRRRNHDGSSEHCEADAGVTNREGLGSLDEVPEVGGA